MCVGLCSAAAQDGIRAFLKARASLEKSAILQFHHKVYYAAALARAVVVPKIPSVVHMEARRSFVPQRRKVHASGRIFPYRGDSGPGEEIPNADPFQFVCVHGYKV